MRNRSFLCSCATVVLVSMLLFMPQVRAEDDDRRDGHRPHVLSNAQVLAATGQSIADWGARWWQWAFEHPDVLGDTTGEFGPLGDVGGPVFFALGAGGDPVRASYKVPGDQHIYCSSRRISGRSSSPAPKSTARAPSSITTPSAASLMSTSESTASGCPTCARTW